MYFLASVDFNLHYTLDCGQVFVWNKKGDWWEGVIDGQPTCLRQQGDKIQVESKLPPGRIAQYLRLDDDLEEIYQEINRDPLMEELTARYRGLRLLRQEPWECLASYICSANNTVKNIKKSVQCLYKIRDNSGFPSPQELAGIDTLLLRRCGLGFRASYLWEAARRIAEGEFDLHRIREQDYPQAREELKKLRGVGDKIADCVLLFSFDKLEAFPVDIHIQKMMETHYGPFKRKKDIRDFARNYFGDRCGYAQEYLYYHSRNLLKQKH